MDILFYNGIIHTIDNNNSIKEAIGIENDKIVFIGSNEEAETMEAKEKIDLNGKLVLPGFTDTHLHLLHYIFGEKSIKLYDATSIDEIIERGKDFLSTNGTQRGWINGRGWDQGNFLDHNRSLTKKDLDKISTKHPIIFDRVCGHAAVVNSIALKKILELEESNDLIEYIDIENGILREAAAFIYPKLLDEISIEELEELIELAQKDLNKEGITSVHTADFIALPDDEWEKVIKAYNSLEKEKKLTVRTYEQCMFNNLKTFKNFLNKGYTTGQGSDVFKIGPLKLLADGSLGARTALMHEPYADDLETSGLQVLDEKTLREFFKSAKDHNMQIAVHGIGDKSIEISADLLNELNGENKNNPLRHGIVHAQFTNEIILNKIKDGNIITYIQPVFINSDMEIAEQRLGKERLKYSYSWKTMRDMGIQTSGGSDCPVESFNILENIYFAVTSKNKNGLPKNGWMPEERLSVNEAVRLFTIDGAYPSFDENKKGSLEIGKYADMVIIDKNIYEINPDDIKTSKVLMTVMNGKIVHNEL